MKKKFLTIALACCTALSLTGCGLDNITKAFQKEDNAVESSLEALPDAGSEILGQNTDTSYENSFIGIGCKFDDPAWVFSPDDTLKQSVMAALESKGTETEAIKEAVTNGSYILDMMAVESNTNSNVTVAIMGSTYESDEAYVDAMVETLQSTMESAYGITNVKTEKVTVDFAGEKHLAAKLTATAGNGTDFAQEQVAIMKGKYIICITATAYDTVSVDSILSHFYALGN